MGQTNTGTSLALARASEAVEIARTLLRQPEQGAYWTGTSQDIWGYSMPGSRRNYARDAGDLWDNSAVGCCLTFITNTFPEAPLVIERKTRDRKWKPVDSHQLLRLMRRPNPFMSGTTLWNSTLISGSATGTPTGIRRGTRTASS
jgi:hypothetical protein